jgi:hypothetical protein
VPGMQEVKAAVGENHLEATALELPHPTGRFLPADYLVGGVVGHVCPEKFKVQGSKFKEGVGCALRTKMAGGMLPPYRPFHYLMVSQRLMINFCDFEGRTGYQ